MENEFTAWLELDDGTKVRVKLCAFDEPRFPTPNEPEVARPPHLAEWAEIMARMTRFGFSRIGS